MNELPALYYDGTSARPQTVRVLVFDNHLEIYSEDAAAPPQSFAFSALHHNQINHIHYIYLDPKGLQYLEATSTDALATLLKAITNRQAGWGQKLMKQKLPVLLLVALVLSAALYLLLVNLVPFMGTKLIGTEQEVILGSKVKEVMLQEAALAGASVDTAGTAQLQAFADQLKLSKQYNIRLTLLNSNIVNAFALPGGEVVVFSGIIKKMDSPEALAALLAHESTHINERHSLKSLLRNAANSIVISVVFGDVTGISGAVVANANSINGLRYSRSLETEADEKGMRLLVENGIDVKGMLQLMKTLKAEGDIPEQLSFLSSHPLTSKRIKNAAQYQKKQAQKVGKRKDLELLFYKLKQQVNS